MTGTAIDLVLGVCVAERHRVASALSPLVARLDDDLTPGDILSAIDDFIDGATDAAAVIDCPSSTSAADLIERFDGAGGIFRGPSGAHLRSIITVVDAAHLLTDLDRDDYYELDLDPGGTDRQLVPWSLIAVTQIEYASVVAVVGWQSLDRADLDEIIALLCHLNPRARLRLERTGWIESIVATAPPRRAGHRPGWVQILDGRLSASKGRHVDTVRYDRMRPFHPARLLAALEVTLPEAAGGSIVRSAGVCRFATRAGLPARWDQVGTMVSFDPFTDPDGESPQGQEIAMIGFDLDVDAITRVLDSCLLTDEEFLAGSAAWRELSDPLPPWVVGGS